MKEPLLSNQEYEDEKDSARSKKGEANSSIEDGKSDVTKLRKQVNQNTNDIRDIQAKIE